MKNNRNHRTAGLDQLIPPPPKKVARYEKGNAGKRSLSTRQNLSAGRRKVFVTLPSFRCLND